MSHSFYNAQWQRAMEMLAQQIELENPPVQLNDNGKPIPEKPLTWDQAYQHYATLYLRYLRIYRMLEDCFDQMLHPQKRRDLKLVLEVVMARLVQVKAECVRFGPEGRQSDYLHGIEELLLDQQLGPESLEVVIPRYFREKSEEDEVNKKRDVLEKCMEECGVGQGGMASGTGDDGEGPGAWMPRLTKEQAIRIIQRNERGRQGMVRAKLMKELREEDNMRKKLHLGGGGGGSTGGSSDTPLPHPSLAATLIQKVFRGHLVRMKIAQQKQEELVFLGMKSLTVHQRKQPHAGAGGVANNPSVTGVGHGVNPADVHSGAAPSSPHRYDPHAKEHQIRLQRKTRQIEHELTYIESLVELQKHVTEVEGPDLKDQMWEERYEWWIRYKERTGKYPDNFNQFYIERGEGEGLMEKKKKKKKAASKDDKDKKKEEKKPAAASTRAKPANKNAEEDLTSKTLIGPTHLVNHMSECVDKYRTVWSPLDESANSSQLHDEELAKEKLRPLIKEKIKKEVDIRLLAYLDNIRLKAAQRAAAKKAAKKGGKKGKKGAKSKPGSAKKSEEGGAAEDAPGADGDEKKESDGSAAAPSASPSKKKKGGGSKKKKGKKAKKCCDGEKACAHMPLGDMINLLVKMGILTLMRPPPTGNAPRLSDLQGEMHWVGGQYIAADLNVDPSMQQVRSVVTENFILPLGSSYVKEQAPLLNALLLYGPPGTGKTLISKAIAAETNACWFDLSPRNVGRKLGTKAEIAKLVHMVFRVAMELAPSIIYIDEVERVFAACKSKKNVPEVVKMKNCILTHKNLLNRQVRVLLVGNTRTPFDAKIDKKDLTKVFGKTNFGKMMLTPLPNYETRLKLWRQFIVDTGVNFLEMERNEKFDLNSLAFISEGYSAGNIQQAVQATLPPRRVAKLLETGRTLESSEFLTALSKTSYTFKQDYANYVKFTEQVTGEAERRRIKELAEAKEAEAKAADAKKGPQPKKKKPAA